MTDVTIVYWRDIPAQVMIGKGRRSVRVPLPERFEQAIDRAAMKANATDTDAYLADWRRETVSVDKDGDDQDVATAVAADLDAEYNQDRMKTLVVNEGRA